MVSATCVGRSEKKLAPKCCKPGPFPQRVSPSKRGWLPQASQTVQQSTKEAVLRRLRKGSKPRSRMKPDFVTTKTPRAGTGKQSSSVSAVAVALRDRVLLPQRVTASRRGWLPRASQTAQRSTKTAVLRSVPEKASRVGGFAGCGGKRLGRFVRRAPRFLIARVGTYSLQFPFHFSVDCHQRWPSQGWSSGEAVRGSCQVPCGGLCWA